jgi:hypothetical protein
MIALITPTGSRPAQFELCRQWMHRQTYPGEVIWIIVDDAIPVSTNSVGEGFKDKWTIVKVYPTPVWQGYNTQARNIKAGIDALIANFTNIEAIFIIEDDDYYHANYLERMMANFGGFDLIGERNTVYYNVLWRRYITNPNLNHASLFQTAFTVNTIPQLEKTYSNRFIDFMLWGIVPNKKLFYENDLAIGMKGMPGRGGIGAGHSRMMAMKDDKDMIYLQSKIGEDAKQYAGYYSGHSQSQHGLFTKKSL